MQTSFAISTIIPSVGLPDCSWLSSYPPIPDEQTTEQNIIKPSIMNLSGGKWKEPTCPNTHPSI